MSSIQITVIDREGNRSVGVEWKDSESLMECLIGHGYPILATCGGNASCSTCHSYLDLAAFMKAGEIYEDEADVLDTLEDTRHPTSRLTCQVEWAENLDGAEVIIAPMW